LLVKTLQLVGPIFTKKIAVNTTPANCIIKLFTAVINCVAFAIVSRFLVVLTSTLTFYAT